MNRAKPLEDFLNTINPNRAERLAAGSCTTCGGQVGEFKDDLSRKEHGISGMCQACQDDFFE